MSHVIITGGGKGERQGNGLQRTSTDRKQTAGPGKTGSTTAGRTQMAGAATGYDIGKAGREAYCFDVSSGARRVAQSMAEQHYFEADEKYGAAEATGKGEVPVVPGDPKGAVRSDANAANGTSGYYADRYGNKLPANVGLTPEEEAALEAALEEEAAEEDKSGKTYGYDESSIEYMERLLERIKESREKNQKAQKNVKKRLNYNFRKVSGSILRAKTVMQAGNALSSANASLSSLRRKSSSDKYNSKEIEAAIQHAKKMVRTARKKVINLKTESREQSLDDTVEHNKSLDNRKEQMAERHKSIANNVKREQELVLLEKALKRIREQKKNVRRRDEAQDLLNADMEYLKRQIQMIRQEQSESGSSGYTYDTSSSEAVAAPVTVPTDNTAAPSAAEVAGAAQSEAGFTAVV